jgi:uncharacterized protein
MWGYFYYICINRTMISTKVHSKQDIFDAIYESKDIISTFGVKSIGLFGSFVRNSATETSDVDLLVDFKPNKKSFDNFMDLAFFLEDLFGRKVEIITPQSLSKHIGPHILKEVEIVHQS